TRSFFISSCLCIFLIVSCIPKKFQDVGNLVYFIIMLHGVGTLMPWNMFITIAPDYYTNYKMKTFDENGTAHSTVYSANFLSYLAIASQIPNLLLNFINIFVTVKGDLTKRISYSLLIVGSMIVFTMSFVYVDTWSWMSGFFVITLASIVILNGANGVYQNSIFGLASDFPFKFTNTVIIGNNLCGTFVTVISIITTISEFFPIHSSFDCFNTQIHMFPVSNNTANAAFAYFATSLFTIFVCFVSFFLLKKQVVFSLTIFPGIMVDVHDELVGQKYSFVIPEKFFVPITCFLLFNVFAFVGSMLAGRFQYPGPVHLWKVVYTRLLFIPFFAFCNYRPLTRKLPVFFTNTWLYIFMAIIMSVSSGYLSGLAMMYAPRVVEPSKSRIASMMAGFFLIFGNVFFFVFF
ncbi:unnamed protein product, partial [Angiostrongylus costaricensis]|uniref:Equilibrative nucleoside transporter 3 n=1 Tax=Angiostrongylus costaricensis TaxID=334426 RepID=A0A0R3P9F8_ANGCS